MYGALEQCDLNRGLAAAVACFIRPVDHCQRPCSCFPIFPVTLLYLAFAGLPSGEWERKPSGRRWRHVNKWTGTFFVPLRSQGASGTGGGTGGRESGQASEGWIGLTELIHSAVWGDYFAYRTTDVHALVYFSHLHTRLGHRINIFVLYSSCPLPWERAGKHSKAVPGSGVVTFSAAIFQAVGDPITCRTVANALRDNRSRYPDRFSDFPPPSIFQVDSIRSPDERDRAQ